MGTGSLAINHRNLVFVVIARSTRTWWLAFLLLCVAACAHPVQTAPWVTHSSLPPNVRPDLAARWFDASGAIRWPQNDGFAAPPVLVLLPPDLLIDRFGGDAGHFFSPKGASYGARALPYICEKLRYTVYRMMRPLFVWAAKAAPWFDEPGGATQFETDAPASLLIADHVIELVAGPTVAPCKP
jgi:hypothetical protein